MKLRAQVPQELEEQFVGSLEKDAIKYHIDSRGRKRKCLAKKGKCPFLHILKTDDGVESEPPSEQSFRKVAFSPLRGVYQLKPGSILKIPIVGKELLILQTFFSQSGTKLRVADLWGEESWMTFSDVSRLGEGTEIGN